MPLTDFQKEVMGVLVDNRSESSHVAGGLVLNAPEDSARFSLSPPASSAFPATLCVGYPEHPHAPVLPKVALLRARCRRMNEPNESLRIQRFKESGCRS